MLLPFLMVLSSVIACCIRSFLPLEFLDDLVQRLETFFPDAPITIEPLVELLQGLSAQFVEPLPRARLHLDQTAALRTFRCCGPVMPS